VTHTASAPEPHGKPHAAPPAKSKEVAKTLPPGPQAPAPELRTAYSAPQSSNNGLLAGAQPVVPAGSFENRWTALR
jgi:hypothetical protein